MRGAASSAWTCFCWNERFGHERDRNRVILRIASVSLRGRRTWLAGIAAAEGEDSSMRRKACYALANGWAEDALPDLERALSAPDVQLRAAAARAIGHIPSPAAQATLQKRLGAETDAMVRGAITASIASRGVSQ